MESGEWASSKKTRRRRRARSATSFLSLLSENWLLITFSSPLKRGRTARASQNVGTRFWGLADAAFFFRLFFLVLWCRRRTRLFCPSNKFRRAFVARTTEKKAPNKSFDLPSSCFLISLLAREVMLRDAKNDANSGRLPWSVEKIFPYTSSLAFRAKTDVRNTVYPRWRTSPGVSGNVSSAPPINSFVSA